MGIKIAGGVKVPQGRFSVYTPPPPPSGKTLWSWGYGGFVGDGENVSKSSPVQIGVLTDWSTLDVSSNTPRLIKTDSTLWSWGSNANGYIGDNTTIQRSSPIQIGALADWSKIAGGSGHALAVKTDGSLWVWGNRLNGRLGLDTSGNNLSSPVQLGSLTDWSIPLRGHDQSLILKNDGSLWVWGQNTYGQLGNETTVTSSSPAQVGGLADWVDATCDRYSTIALKSDGTLWSWGRNSGQWAGVLGLGDVINRSSPVQIGILTDWVSIGVGERHTLAIKSDGSLWSWGDNASGELGHGDVVFRSSPVQLGSLTNWSSISGKVGAYDNSAAIKTDGTLWVWGTNGSGKLGLGDSIKRSSPVQVGSDTNWIKIDPAGNNTFALKSP